MRPNCLCARINLIAIINAQSQLPSLTHIIPIPQSHTYVEALPWFFWGFRHNVSATRDYDALHSHLHTITHARTLTLSFSRAVVRTLTLTSNLTPCAPSPHSWSSEQVVEKILPMLTRLNLRVVCIVGDATEAVHRVMDELRQCLCDEQSYRYEWQMHAAQCSDRVRSLSGISQS